MRVQTGLSSNTLPQATAAELAAMVVAAGGDMVDLRLDRGQEWERHGACAAYDVFASAGVSVGFVARAADTPIALGAGCGCHGPDFAPLKLSAGTTTSLQHALEAATAAGWPVLLETHAGGPGPADLVTCCETWSGRLVFDNRGWYEMGGADRDLQHVAPYVDFVQVKGFDPADPNRRHRPLVRDDLAVVAELVAAGAPVRGVTVETRAAEPLRDLELLREFVTDNVAEVAEGIVA